MVMNLILRTHRPRPMTLWCWFYGGEVDEFQDNPVQASLITSWKNGLSNWWFTGELFAWWSSQTRSRSSGLSRNTYHGGLFAIPASRRTLTAPYVVEFSSAATWSRSPLTTLHNQRGSYPSTKSNRYQVERKPFYGNIAFTGETLRALHGTIRYVGDVSSFTDELKKKENCTFWVAVAVGKDGTVFLPQGTFKFYFHKQVL
jgi:hypothetical protein